MKLFSIAAIVFWCGVAAARLANSEDEPRGSAADAVTRATPCDGKCLIQVDAKTPFQDAVHSRSDYAKMAQINLPDPNDNKKSQGPGNPETVDGKRKGP